MSIGFFPSLHNSTLQSINRWNAFPIEGIRSIAIIIEIVFDAIRHIRSSQPQPSSPYQQWKSQTTGTIIPTAPLTEQFLPFSNPSFKDQISLPISNWRKWLEINPNPTQEASPPNSKTIGVLDLYSGSKKSFTVTTCPLLEVPQEVASIFLRHLDDQSLLAVQATCKSLESLVEPICKHYLESKLGSELAQKLKQKRPNWNRLMRDIYSPIKTKSKRLTVVKKTKESHPFLMIKSDDTCERLRFNLERLDPADKDLLNVIFEMTDNDSLLKSVAKNGLLKTAQLLIDFGALDALYTPSHDYEYDEQSSTVSTHTGYQSPVASCSALLTAATHAQVDMVRLLLEHGALPDLNVQFIRHRYRNRSYNPDTDKYQPLLGQLIWDVHQLNYSGQGLEFYDPFSPDILWCIILIINAWRSKSGADRFCQDKEAKTILNQSIENRNLNVATILMSFGLRPDQENAAFDQLALNAIKYGRLDVLKWLHHHQLYNLVEARDENGRSLLYTTKSYDNELAIQFLRGLNTPTDIVGPDGKNDLEAGNEKLHELLRKDIFDLVLNGRIWGQFEMISRPSRLEYYLKQGLDLNVPCHEGGDTVLHGVAWGMESFVRMNRARKKEYVQYIQTMLTYGANPCKKNSEGKTPLDILREIRHSYATNSPYLVPKVEPIIQLMQSYTSQ